MIGMLTKEQNEHVLRCGLIGRIGCVDDGKVYIVPVTYVFLDKYIYAHSKEGMKVEMMRKHPQVCFQVDSIENMTNWRSVVVQGRFQELKSETERSKALKILKDRLMPYLLSETMRSTATDGAPERVEKERAPVVYRIEITAMSGRYEKNIHFGSLLD